VAFALAWPRSGRRGAYGQRWMTRLGEDPNPKPANLIRWLGRSKGAQGGLPWGGIGREVVVVAIYGELQHSSVSTRVLIGELIRPSKLI
jgi:hypothetical protein